MLALGKHRGLDHLLGQADGAFLVLGRTERFGVVGEEVVRAVLILVSQDAVAVARVAVLVGGVRRAALLAAEVGRVAVGAGEGRVGPPAAGGVAVDVVARDALIQGLAFAVAIGIGRAFGHLEFSQLARFAIIADIRGWTTVGHIDFYARSSGR